MSVLNFFEFKDLKKNLVSWLQEEIKEKNIYNGIVIFVSYGSKSNRCKVWNIFGLNIEQIVKRVVSFLDKTYANKKQETEYLKIDVAYNIKEERFKDVCEQVCQQKHNNHYRKGISFDDKFEIAFMEQELYAKAIIKGIVYNEPNFFDEKNLNDSIKKKYPAITRSLKLENIKNVRTFDTVGVFCENGNLIRLHSTGCENGVRIVEKMQLKNHIKELIKNNADFLYKQILADGKFIYGYFPAYNRQINSYNTVRHCTAIYALLETLEIDYKKDYLEKIQVSIQFAIDNFYREVSDKGFMIDGVGNSFEIKLGSNAAAIFMFAKYQEISKDNRYQFYAEKLAKGIQSMVDDEGETTHVLKYPSLEVKEKFRIVYYDGEAALGLLRLYQHNHDYVLLDTVKLMFKNFINKKYHKYHDHWLSYCSNELTIYSPEEKYFQFGLNNYLQHMSFIYERKTAYATFLEMMMSAYKMVSRLKKLGLDDLFENSKFNQLKALIEHRVEFQRATGYFYPEIAMYMAKPDQILNSFYVRHDRFRTRIDDQEHNLSGYVAYVLYL